MAIIRIGMKPLARLEQLIEGLVEGGSAFLKGSLEPVELAKKLEREMESHRQIGPGGASQAPNYFSIHLHPDDFADLRPYRRSLEQEFAAYLVQEATDQGFSLRSRATVEILRDPKATRKWPRFSTRFVDPEVFVQRPDIAATEATARIDLDQPAPPFDADIALTYQTNAGESVRVSVDVLPFRVGRSLENSLPIDDPRISRTHAEIAVQHRRLSLVDLKSRNGTTVNGTPVVRCLLEDGDVISMGGFELSLNLS